MQMTPAPTREVQRLITWAAKLGLNPRIDDPHRGSVRVVLNGSGENAGFGVFFYGAFTGKVLRGSLQHGNSGQVHRGVGHAGVVGMLDTYNSYRVLSLGGPDVRAPKRDRLVLSPAAREEIENTKWMTAMYGPRRAAAR